MGRFHIKQGDTSPAKKDKLLNSDESVVDLTGASVDFHMVDENDSVVVDSTANIDDATGGVVSYAWASQDTETSGVFEAEWEVTFPSGNVETFPNSYNELVVIEEQLA